MVLNGPDNVHTVIIIGSMFLMQEIELPPELEVGQGYGKVSWSIRAIWENYAGWFHHESTTELYSVPRKSIHGDLIELAGGKKALVDRAVLKLSEWHLELAVHLLDIVLSEGDDAAAIEAMIEAHEKLLAESKNFWLSAWLTNEAGKLRTRKS